MGGAFFFHVSAVASLLLSTLCGDPCQRLRGVLLHPRRPLDCIGPGAPLPRPSLAHHLVLAVLIPIPQMCPISLHRDCVRNFRANVRDKHFEYLPAFVPKDAGGVQPLDPPACDVVGDNHAIDVLG